MPNAAASADMTNTALSRLLSIENIIIVGAILTTFLMGYAVLADDQTEQAEEIADVKSEQRVIKETLNKVKTDVAVIRSGQESYSKVQEKRYDELRSDMKEILGIIRGNGD